MSTDDHKELVRRFVREVFQEGRVGSVDELVAPDFVSASFGITEEGPAKLRAATEQIHRVLTDVSFRVDDLIAEGDRVAARLTARATPTGQFLGMEPTGKSYEIGEIHMFRIANGRIAEHWHQFDAMGATKQLAGDAG